MIDLLKEIIIDSQEAGFFTGVPRDLIRVETLPGKASVFIGVRRSGKSTFMYQLIEGLKKSGVSEKNIVYINFVDERLHFLKEEGLSLITEAYYQMYPEKKKSEKVYFFFDEIQSIPEWESFVERLMRSENSAVYITGSSSKMLSEEIATQMRGRSMVYEVFPFSFPEFLKKRGIEYTKQLSSKKRVLIQNAFEDYFKSGGFPEVTGDISDAGRLKVHQDYFQSVLYRDLIERHDITHPGALKDIALKLIDNCASLYSVNSIYRYLKSLDHVIQKSSVSQYIEWLQDSYFLFSVPVYDASIRRRRINPRKIYCIDHAMIRSLTSGILVNSGHLLENLIFTALRRSTNQIYYYTTSKKREVDFVAVMGRGRKTLIQVSEELTREDTRNREITSLIQGMEELNLNKGYIVTKNTSESMETNGRKIEIIPAWKFLLYPLD